MERIDRSKIEEVPILPVCFGTITPSDACYSLPCCKQKIRCKEQTLMPIIDADTTQAEHIRIQTRIRKELKNHD
jgi:hypothetical protein